MKLYNILRCPSIKILMGGGPWRYVEPPHCVRTLQVEWGGGGQATLSIPRYQQRRSDPLPVLSHGFIKGKTRGL